MVVDITLERKKDGKVESMAAGHVFATGDIIRLKLVSHYDGFLYVMDQGSSGKFATVFPAMQTGSDNRVQRSKQYLVPAVEDGWFEVNGPAGFDVLYFLLSPTALTPPVLSSFAAPAATARTTAPGRPQFLRDRRCRGLWLRSPGAPRATSPSPIRAMGRWV
jgi:hypothetical protein